MRQASDVWRQRILAMVGSRGSARVSDLAEELEVSIITVRRDVEELARAGKLRRGHGVACSVVAYDDVVAALGSTPPPKAGVGRVAAELLLERLRRHGTWRTRCVELLLDLKIRGWDPGDRPVAPLRLPEPFNPYVSANEGAALSATSVGNAPTS